MAIQRIVLTGADAKGSAIDGIATLASLTTIHTVPSGEIHTIWLTITNVNASAVVIKGDIGATATSFWHSLAAQSTVEFGPIALSNTTLKLGAVANGSDIQVYGSVEKNL